MSGKGSAPRPIANREDFRRRWNRTFKKKQTNELDWTADEFRRYLQKPFKSVFGEFPVFSPPYDR